MINEKTQKKIEDLKKREDETRANFNALMGGLEVINEFLQDEEITGREREKLEARKQALFNQKEESRDRLNALIGALQVLQEINSEELEPEPEESSS